MGVRDALRSSSQAEAYLLKRIGKRPLLLGLTGLSILSMLVAAFAAFHSAGSAKAASSITGTTRTITLGGTGSPTTGDAPASGTHDITSAEFPGEGDEEANGPDPFSGTIV